MKKVAIIQSNYIPWKGYFDIIHDVDEFVFYDEVQYTTRDWRSRNKIQTSGGTMWLSVPVTGSRKLAIDEVLIMDGKWQKKHFDTLLHNYNRAPYFYLYKDFLTYVYLDKQWNLLSDLNQFVIREISSRYLKTNTLFTTSRDYFSRGSKHEKLLNLVKASGASEYISGPAAKDYIVPEDYEKENIKLTWKDYSGYPEYKQLHSPFSHYVTVLDLLFNTGPDAPYYIWGWR